MDFALLIWTLALLWISREAQFRLRGERYWLTHPYFWFSFFWIIQFALSALPLFNYLFPLTAKAAFKIAGFHLAFWSGMIAVMILTRTRMVPEEGGIDLGRAVFKIAAPVLLICFILTLRQSMAGSSYSLIERIVNPDTIAAARKEVFSGVAAGQTAGILVRIAGILQPFSILALSAFGYYLGAKVLSWKTNKFQFACGIAIFLVMFVGGPLVFGGRMYSFIAFFVFWLPFKLGQSAGRLQPLTRRYSITVPRRLLLPIAGVVAAITVSVVFQGLRDDSGESVNTILLVTHHTSISELVSRSFSVPDHLMVFLSYFTSSSKILGYYIDIYGTVPGPFGGDYNFPTSLGLLALFTGTQPPMPFWDIRFFLFDPLVSNGFFGNVWATLPRDLMADFGLNGAVMFLFLLGALSQRAFDIYRSSPGPVIAGFCVILALIALWSAFHSIMFFGGIDVLLVVLTCFFGFPLHKIKLKGLFNQRNRGDRFVN